MFKTESLHDMQKQAQIFYTEILLDLHHHIARLAWLIQEYLFLVKKVIRTNTEHSVELGLFAPSLIHSFSFVYSNSNY